MILAYRILTTFIYPFLIILLFYRILLKKEDAKRYKEKIFIKNFDIKKKNTSRLLWFHAASIGEFLSIMPIIKKINENRKNIQFLITTNTLSSGRLAENKLKKFDNIFHRYMPFDVDHLVENFLNQWKPDKIFLVDSEIWPNLLLKAKLKRIPIALINARITKKSFSRWNKFPLIASKIFGIFNLCICANEETKKFLEKLKAKNIYYEGNIKLINEGNGSNDKFTNKNHKILSESNFWIAASIHKEEDIFCLNTHKELKKHFDKIITIIAPRHLDRVNKIEKISKSFNFNTQVLNNNEEILEEAEVIIINSFGVLKTYFQYAKSVYIGKSIIERLKIDSGQNPIDAAYLNCKIYHGPYVSNFYEIYEILKKNNISKKIENYYELSENLIDDFQNPNKLKNVNSSIINSLGKNILNKTMKILDDFLNDKVK